MDELRQVLRELEAELWQAWREAVLERRQIQRLQLDVHQVQRSFEASLTRARGWR